MQFLRRSQSMLRRRPLLRGTRSHPQVVLSLSWPTRRMCTSSSVVEGWLKDWETTKKDSGWMGKHLLALLDTEGLKDSEEELQQVNIVNELKNRRSIKMLIDIRTDLLDYLGDKSGGRAITLPQRHKLLRFNDLMRRLLAHWCAPDSLLFKLIAPESSMALLQNLLRYEGVHPMNSVEEVKIRLGYGKKCFGLFHSSLPDLPLTFVHIALMPSITSFMKDIHQYSSRESEANTAIFYSINSTQKGLNGVSLGNYLIKTAARTLHLEYPNLKTFSTLSPIPGFTRWLNTVITTQGSTLFSPEEVVLIKNHVLNSTDWPYQDVRDALKPILMRACEHYLINEKRGTSLAALDPVANFHLSNGASVEKLNWMADLSPKRMKESAGVMVNYKYSLFDGAKQYHPTETPKVSTRKEGGEESVAMLMEVLQAQKQNEEARKKENDYLAFGKIDRNPKLW